MSKHFRLWKIDQVQLLPPSVQDFVPKDHLSRFIVALVRESLDLGEIEGSAAQWLCERDLLLAPDRQGVRRTRRLHDDRGA
jgi:hypothetical protein